MRVDLLIDNLGSGGAQRQLIELAATMRARFGVDARIVAYRDVAARDADVHRERIAAAGLPVSIVAKRCRFDPTLPVRLGRALRGADVVQSYMPIPSLWTRAALALLPRGERPCWIACERTDPTRTSRMQRGIRALAYRGADAVTANSHGAAAELERRLRIPRERVHYIPNGIDLAAWDTAAARPLPWPMAGNRFHLVLVGRLSHEKNHTLLLEAVARLDPCLRAGWTVWFLGASTREPRGEQVVREAIRRLGLEATVEIRPPTPEVAAVVARASLLVLPSRHEGFPNAVLEAMASRTVVVAAPVGDVPALVEDGRTGFLFRPDDPADLARVLARASALAPAERRAIAEAARHRIEAEFRIEEVAVRYLALYAGFLSSRGARTA